MGAVLMYGNGNAEGETGAERSTREKREEDFAEKEGLKMAANRRFLVRMAILFVYAAWAVMTVRAPSAFRHLCVQCVYSVCTASAC